MTRFLLSLDDAVDIIFEAVKTANRGETYIPRVPSAKVTDIADILIGDRPIKTQIVGIRPGEKIHEILVSEEEAYRTLERSNRYYTILPMLPEIATTVVEKPALNGEYSSESSVMSPAELATMLKARSLMLDQVSPTDGGEFLR